MHEPIGIGIGIGMAMHACTRPVCAYLSVHKDLRDTSDVVGDLMAVLQRLAAHQACIVLVGVVGGGNQYVITQPYLHNAHPFECQRRSGPSPCPCFLLANRR